jgi:hypothetical protein
MAHMSGYTKLFSSILASTIWREPNEVRLVWITLLAMADKDGIAEGSVPGLADFARIPVEATREALARLSAPDPDSRSQEQDGRRIEPVDGGWRLINHGKYRAKMGADERREYNRVKQAQHRARVSQSASLTIKKRTHCQDNTEAEAEAEAVRTKASSADADYERFRDAYPVSRRVGGKAARRAFSEAMKGKPPGHLDAMIAAVEQHKRSEQWQSPKLIPLMTTWLNGERWVQVLPPPSLFATTGKTAGNLAALQRFVERHQ